MEAMKKSVNPNRIKWFVIVIVLALFTAIFTLILTSRLHFCLINGVVFFYDLPQETVNGEWSSMTVAEGHITLRNNINELTDFSTHVIRVEVLSEKSKVLYVGFDYPYPVVYSVYRLRIFDIYKGSINENEIEILQTRRIPRTYLNVSTQNAPYFIRLPLTRGDDLILFLTYEKNPYALNVDERWHFNAIQGLYRYTPQEFRDDYENWIFESINPHNNIILTEQDLLQISEMFFNETNRQLYENQ